MRKFLCVLVVSVVSLAAGAADCYGQVKYNGRSSSYGTYNYSSRSRSAASAPRPTPYDYISRAYMMQYIERHVGPGYAVPAMQSVDAGYKASSGRTQSSGSITVPVGNAFIGPSGIKYSAPFNTK